MTRIWTPPLCELDNKRLLGQHREIHIICGGIGKGRAWNGYEDPKYRDALFQYHDDVVAEMRIRGYTGHKTPLERQLERVAGPQVGLPHYGKDLARDRWELLCRWGGIFKGRMVADHVAWQETFDRYRVEGGCHHPQPGTRISGGLELCPICKRAVREQGSTVWFAVEYMSDEESPVVKIPGVLTLGDFI